MALKYSTCPNSTKLIPMKILTAALSLIFIITLSFYSYAEWVKVAGRVNGNTYYVDFNKIQKVGDYMYYWLLVDYIEPSPLGYSSVRMYVKGDCKLFQLKSLSWSFHSQPMGGGSSRIDNYTDKDWRIALPYSSMEATLKLICDL